MDMIEFAKKTVVKFYQDYVNLPEDQKPTKEKCKIVWSCKTLQNWKVIVVVFIASIPDLFEITYDGDKQTVYVDNYRKIANVEIHREDIENDG